MKRLTLVVVLVLSAVSMAEGQMWTGQPNVPGTYRIYGPGGRGWLRQSSPLEGYNPSGSGAGTWITTVQPLGIQGYRPGVRTWLSEPNGLGGYNTYGARGRTWVSQPNAAGGYDTYGPAGRLSATWNSAGAGVTNRPDGQALLTVPIAAGGYITYGPGGRTWVSQRLDR